MPWCGHLLNKSLNLSHASNKDSSYVCLKEVISFLILAFFVGGKYLVKNFSANPFHKFTELGSNELSYTLARSFSEYGNSLNRKASSVTPGILKLLATSKNCFKWRCGSSWGSPLNCPTVCSIWNIMGLNSKWLAVISGRTIPVFMVSGSKIA